MAMIGIYDCFGYGAGYDVSFEERYRLIKSAGFDCVMLWWSDRFGRGSGYREDARLARKAGLAIENIHAPVHEQNFLSQDDLDGESVFQNYLQCVYDCAGFDIPTMVVHLPDDAHPIQELGMERLAILIETAEKYAVQIAFENLANVRNLELVLGTFRSKNVGYCYDSCHHINYAPKEELLQLYGDRLMALHLHDNGGMRGQHRLPLDGAIDWPAVMRKIVQTGYKGTTALEPMNWDYTDLPIQQFLELAYQRAVKLEAMRAIEAI